MPETILIRGGSGFLGLQFARELIAQRKKIGIFDLKPPDSLLKVSNNVVHLRGDITNLPQVLMFELDCPKPGDSTLGPMMIGSLMPRTSRPNFL
ncbi:MAG: hypothetical protein ABSH06_01895 [Thermodesulfobacteriota bacterium]